jgi:hypothetical protein
MAFLCLSCQAVVAQKHVHGDGQLLIAQDQQQWQFQLKKNKAKEDTHF